jgi:diketogulonate reductase-like aldo/keto reductase
LRAVRSRRNEDQNDATIERLRTFDESAKRLRRDTLDLCLIHWPRPRVHRYVESWKAFVRLRHDGRVRSIGVSNFNRDHLERIIDEAGVGGSGGGGENWAISPR